jgi:hypothetical protein
MTDPAGTDVWDAFDTRPMRMGLHPLDPATWTVPPDPPGLAEELDRKASLLDHRGPEALATSPDADPAAAELLDALVDHLLRDHPDRYTTTGPDRHTTTGPDRGALTLRDDGRRLPLDGHPLDVAGRLVAEDWCLVRPGDPPVLAAGTLCSPNRWRLGDKLGLPLTAVHGPVPGYAADLARPVDRFLAGRRNVWRRNWSILDAPDLFQPGPAPSRTPPRVPDGLWVRSERQTLVRLPITGWWVFGIRTSVRPLAEAADKARIAAAIAALPEESVRYKELEAFRTPLLAWLQAVAASS